MAQNRSDVVRVVLDVAKVKDYSVFELAAPDRLVVDVYGPGGKTIRSSNAGAVSAGPVNAGAVNAAAVNTAAGANATAGSTVKTGPLAAAPRPAVGLLPLSAKAARSLLCGCPWLSYPFAGNPFADKSVSGRVASSRVETRPSLQSDKGPSERGESARNESAKNSRGDHGSRAGRTAHPQGRTFPDASPGIEDRAHRD